MSVDEAQLAREQRGEVLTTIDVEWAPSGFERRLDTDEEDSRDNLLLRIDEARTKELLPMEWDVIRAMPEHFFLELAKGWVGRAYPATKPSAD